jgi:para-nitrobenzyl esterase
MSMLAGVLAVACACSESMPEPTTGAAGAGAPEAGAAASEAVIDRARPRVVVEGGELEGRWAGANVRSFLGIPYASPPTGALRFRRPEPHEGWTALRDAGEFGGRCPQLPAAINPRGDTEDCLSLNVWTPARTPGDRLPVMVWIHGGGHTTGSASERPVDPGTTPLFSGEPLSAGYGVLVVTLNYRLGVLGFLGHAALAAEGVAPGNQGLWDQRLALQWVQQNIAAFGGDPSNVTLFGESAGSVDVCLHVASPRSRGLFHRAISQSGSCTTRRRVASEAEVQGRELAAQLGCAAADELACLRSKPVAELLDAAIATVATLPWGPIVDGDFVPEQPRALFDRGEIARVPYMLGSNTDEGTGFVLDALNVSETTYLTELMARFPPPVEEIAQQYPASTFADAPNPHFAALARAVGDARFVCAAHDTALRAHAAGLAVHLYNFDIPIDGPDGVLGSVHAGELGFVFGTWPAFTPETKLVSDRMLGYWSEFARAGDPNGGDRLVWPAFTDRANVRINFGLQATLLTDFRAAECAFWGRRYEAAFASAAP